MKKPTKAKSKAGRPTKFSPAISKKICAAIAEGMPFKHAAALAGISQETFTVWRKEYVGFSESIQAAVAKGILANLKIISRAAKTDVRAAMWFLEHVHPEHFARSRIDHKHEVSGPNGGPIMEVCPISAERIRDAYKAKIRREMEEEASRPQAPAPAP